MTVGSGTSSMELRDVFGLGGLALLAVGVGLIWSIGAGLVALGLGLFYLGVIHGAAE